MWYKVSTTYNLIMKRKQQSHLVLKIVISSGLTTVGS